MHLWAPTAAKADLKKRSAAADTTVPTSASWCSCIYTSSSRTIYPEKRTCISTSRDGLHAAFPLHLLRPLSHHRRWYPAEQAGLPGRPIWTQPPRELPLGMTNDRHQGRSPQHKVSSQRHGLKHRGKGLLDLGLLNPLVQLREAGS